MTAPKSDQPLRGESREARNDALVRKYWGVFVDVGVDYRGFRDRHGHSLDRGEMGMITDMIEKQERVLSASAMRWSLSSETRR